ncbi:MAG: ABC transporter permease [Nitrospirae bacterium]|nr:ABC transporter permease [Nitrospirota bacterium]
MGISNKFDRVWQLVWKEFRQIFRDPRLARLIFVAPIIQLVIFGYAVSTDIRNTPVFVVDHDPSRFSREVVEALTVSGFFKVVGRSDKPSDIVKALDYGDAMMGVEIPVDFTKRLEERSGAEIQLLFDGTNSNTAMVARSYAERIVQNYGNRFGVVERPLTIDLRERAWYNPSLVSRNYYVPAVVGIIILLVCLLLTSLAIVREREIGTLEQILVSPLTAGELIAGKTIPFAIISLADMTLVTAVALLWFRIPFEGNFFNLFFASILYILPALGIGLFISTISNTQQEAFMTSFLFFQPAVLLSGFMFPVSSMPDFFRWLTLLNPVRHYLEIVRGIFLKGTGLLELWPQYTILLIMGVATLWFSALRFKKKAV